MSRVNAPPVVAPVLSRRPRKQRWPWIVAVSAGSLMALVLITAVVLCRYPALTTLGDPYHQRVYQSLEDDFGSHFVAVRAIDGPRTKGGLIVMRARVTLSALETEDLMWLFDGNRTIPMTPLTHPQYYLLWNEATYLDGSPAEPWELPPYVAARVRGGKLVGGMAQGILDGKMLQEN